jgi:hypothetical protein
MYINRVAKINHIDRDILRRLGALDLGQSRARHLGEGGRGDVFP